MSGFHAYVTVLEPKVLAEVLVSTSENVADSLVPAKVNLVPPVPNHGEFGQVPTEI